MEDKRQKPAKLGEVLNQLFTRTGFGRRIAEEKIFSKWGEIVGDTVAANTEPVRISNHLLWVKVSNAIWMHQLQFMKELIVKKLNEKLENSSVEDLRFFVGEIGSPAQKDDERNCPPLKDFILTKGEKELIAKEVAGISDPELRKALSAIFLKTLQKKTNHRENIEGR